MSFLSILVAVLIIGACCATVSGNNSNNNSGNYNSSAKIKYCSSCGYQMNENEIICGFCGYNSDTKFPLPDISTKHINKGGLSFDYPGYYDVSDVPVNNEAYKSMVGLSKDGNCEIYVVEYWHSTFNNNTKRNPYLIKEYLKNYNYTNITENGKFDYCYNANIDSKYGKLNAVILFNFNYSNVIMIACYKFSDLNYNFVNDMRIINDSVRPI